MKIALLRFGNGWRRSLIVRSACQSVKQGFPVFDIGGWPIFDSLLAYQSQNRLPHASRFFEAWALQTLALCDFLDAQLGLLRFIYQHQSGFSAHIVSEAAPGPLLGFEYQSALNRVADGPGLESRWHRQHGGCPILRVPFAKGGSRCV